MFFAETMFQNVPKKYNKLTKYKTIEDNKT